MDYFLSKEVMPNTALRNSFNELAAQTFGISFEDWYQKGYWSKSNIPYTLFHGDTAVANISVNIMEVLWYGTIRRYIQLGTVMTAEAYRNQGISRFIMNEIKADWEARCDSMLLFANNNVLEFYPRFGFIREPQYQYSMEIVKGMESSRRLNIDSPDDLRLLKRYYEKTNPFSKLQVINDFNLLMFYCISDMKDCIYYSDTYDAVIIAEQIEDTWHCFDIFCDAGNSFLDIITSAAPVRTKKIILKFTPQNGRDFQVQPTADDAGTLFILDGKENVFRNEKLLFPSISHT